MARNHSDQTKQRISQGMKQAHSRRKLAENPTNQRAKVLHDKFQGSTTELISPRIRNYGGIGRDVTTVTPEIKPSPAELAVQLENRASELGLTRPFEVKIAKEGQRFVAGAPEHPSTKSQSERKLLMAKRAEIRRGAQ